MNKKDYEKVLKYSYLLETGDIEKVTNSEYYNLSGADLSDADLSDLRLEKINLSNANLERAILVRTNLSQAKSMYS
jgi:uncharacterized protein YjbI with pentapeptide repeats